MIDKFRAWNKKTGEWHNASDPELLTFYGFSIFGECTMLCTPSAGDLQYLEVTQSTGLKYHETDQEVWEGDIIESNYYGIFEIIFRDGSFTGRSINKKGMHVGLSLLIWGDPLHGQNEAVYLGNKYENPELLAQT